MVVIQKFYTVKYFHTEVRPKNTCRYLPTEPGNNGTKLEGEWAGSRSNLRELKSWSLRDFIVQNRVLLLCAVTESGATPLSVNSRSAASSETCNTAQPTNHITPFMAYDDNMIYKPDAPDSNIHLSVDTF